MKIVDVELCAGTACHLMGAPELSTALNSLSVDQKQLVRVRFTHCLNACGQGPNARVNGQLYSNLTAESLLEIVLKQLETITT